jgi:small conductance mechanosensitive channel
MRDNRIASARGAFHAWCDVVFSEPIMANPVSTGVVANVFGKSGVVAAADAAGSGGAVDKVIDKLIDFSFEYGPKIIAAVIMLTVGVMISRWVGRLVEGALAKKKFEPPVKALIVKIVRLAVIAMTVVMVLEKLGVAIAPLIAGIGVAGLGISLAMQGVLANIVAGLTIIFTKPFRLGEYLELVGVHGEVISIELFNTTLAHADRSLVVIPNRKIVGEILHNYGVLRQLDLSVSVAYNSDLNRAIALVNGILAANPRAMKDPAPVVGTSVLGDSAITIAIKPWVKIADYVAAQAEINKAVIERFREAGIEIPFPQREVRILNAPPAPALNRAA